MLELSLGIGNTRSRSKTSRSATTLVIHPPIETNRSFSIEKKAQATSSHQAQLGFYY